MLQQYSVRLQIYSWFMKYCHPKLASAGVIAAFQVVTLVGTNTGRYTTTNVRRSTFHEFNSKGNIFGIFRFMNFTNHKRILFIFGWASTQALYLTSSKELDQAKKLKEGRGDDRARAEASDPESLVHRRASSSSEFIGGCKGQASRPETSQSAPPRCQTSHDGALLSRLEGGSASFGGDGTWTKDEGRPPACSVPSVCILQRHE